MIKTAALCTCIWWITLFSTFLWRPLHDDDEKPPNLTFYEGHGNTTTNFPSSFWTWVKFLRIQLQDLTYWAGQIDAIKFERTQIHFFLPTFSLPSSSLLSSSSSLWYEPVVPAFLKNTRGNRLARSKISCPLFGYTHWSDRSDGKISTNGLWNRASFQLLCTIIYELFLSLYNNPPFQTRLYRF